MPGPLIHRLPGLPQPQPGGLRIAVHPGSGSARKNWPVDRWSTLCAWLRDTLGAELLIVTGEAESAEARTLAHFGHPAHQLPLRILCTQLSPCHLFVGHDSGITHLAAACGVACAVLFGPTDPAMWAPPAPGVRVIRAGPALASISVSDVQHAIADCLARHP
jgi:heptosyltransferase-2